MSRTNCAELVIFRDFLNMSAFGNAVLILPQPTIDLAPPIWRRVISFIAQKR